MALNAVGDPRLLLTRKQDALMRCICMFFSSALWSSTCELWSVVVVLVAGWWWVVVGWVLGVVMVMACA